MIQGKKGRERKEETAHTKANRDGLHMRERARARRERREREKNEE